jgi:hypothetical protein
MSFASGADDDVDDEPGHEPYEHSPAEQISSSRILCCSRSWIATYRIKPSARAKNTTLTASLVKTIRRRRRGRARARRHSAPREARLSAHADCRCGAELAPSPPGPRGDVRWHAAQRPRLLTFRGNTAAGMRRPSRTHAATPSCSLTRAPRSVASSHGRTSRRTTEWASPRA